MTDMRASSPAHDDIRDALFTASHLNTPGSASSGISALSPIWRQALNRRDARSCHQLAAQAGASKDAAALADLCALVETPSDARLALLGRRKAWRWARVAGINALGRIGAAEAIPTLVRALFDPDPHIRESAAYELPTFGPDVVPILRRTLREAPDWTVSGMESAIGVLERMGDTSAAPELAHVIAEQLPGDPTRWARQTFVRPFTLVAALFCVAWGAALFHVTPDPSVPVWESSLEVGISMAVAGFVPLVFLYMLLVCVVFLPLLNLCAARERGRLAQSAIRALGHFNDKRPLPLLMDIALGPRPTPARMARTALLRLLPLLDASDCDHLAPRTRHQFEQALAKAEPGMTLALLNALEHVGFGQAAETVAVLAQEGATVDVRERATRLLPLLHERQRAEVACASLLRPTSAPTAIADELLRSTSLSSPFPQAQLLRPSCGNSDSSPKV